MPIEPTSKIYTFKNVKLTISGRAYPVSSIMLYLQETSIPLLRLTLDPAHVYGAGGMDQASKADLTAASGWLKDLLLLAEAKTDATALTVDIYEATNPTVPVQKLNLTNWILNSAGLTGVSATGRFSLAVELLHPIAAIQMGGMNIGSIFGKFNWGLDAVTADNIPQGISQVLWRYRDIITPNPTIANMETDGSCGAVDVPVEEYVEAFRNKLDTVAAELMAHLLWDTSLVSAPYSEWPLQCIDKEELIKNGLVSYVLGGIVETNLWEVIARHICSQWAVSIIPTFWKEHLTMLPFTPWDEPRIDLRADVVADVDFPSADPNPLAGTWISYSKTAVNPDWSYFINGNNVTEIAFGGMGYIPDITAKGQIANVQAPGWYSNMLGSDGADAGEVTNPPEQETNFENVTVPSNMEYSDSPAVSPTVGGTSIEHKLYRDGLYIIAKQLFLTYFRQETEIRLACPLLITYEFADTGPEKYLIPGVNARVLNEDNTVAFAFHVTAVTHRIDCQEGVAGTAISGTYTRPDGAYPGRVEQPEYNPMYYIGS